MILFDVLTAVPGIAYLSGGQAVELVGVRLSTENVRRESRRPWALPFSFARDIQHLAMEIWHGECSRPLAAQQALIHRARYSRTAKRREYHAAMKWT